MCLTPTLPTDCFWNRNFIGFDGLIVPGPGTLSFSLALDCGPTAEYAFKVSAVEGAAGESTKQSGGRVNLAKARGRATVRLVGITMPKINKASGEDRALVRELLRFAKESPTEDAWSGSLEEVNETVLTTLLSGLRTDMRDDRFVAYRATVVAVLERKLADRLTAAVTALNNSTTKLAWVMIFVGVVGVIVAIVGIVLSYRLPSN